MKSFLPVIAYQKIGVPAKRSRVKNEWTSPNKLECMLAWLTQQGYTCITPAELAKPLPAKPILLTFWGGYASTFTTVFPLLQKYHTPATVFVAVDVLGTYNQWQAPHVEPWQDALTADQLQQMYQSGLVQVGSLGLLEQGLHTTSVAIQQQAWQESIFRLTHLYHITPCAVGYLNKQAVFRPEVDLPIFSLHAGKNSLTEKHHFFTLSPTWFTYLLLRLQK